jgi:hypothetical protein
MTEPSTFTVDTVVTEPQRAPIAGDYVSWSSSFKKKDKQPFENVLKQGKINYESLFQQGTRCLIESNNTPPSLLPTNIHADWTADKTYQFTCKRFWFPCLFAPDKTPCLFSYVTPAGFVCRIRVHSLRRGGRRTLTSTTPLHT